MGQTTNIVPGSTTLVETDKQCNSRDYCWQDWRLEFRVDSVCLRIFHLDLRMTAVYENERKEAAVTSEILPEASCGAVIDDVSTPLSGAILLSPDASDFSQETQLYRYHIEETVYAQITISDNLAPITNVAVAEYTLTQNGNTFDQPFTNIANSGNQAVVSFDLNEPVAGTIPGIVTTLTVKVDITYGDGTVRRRQLRSEYETNDLPDEYSVSSTFIVQMPGCLAPEGNAGEVLRSKCRAGDSAEIRLCERGLWRLLGERCPESPLIVESKDADDVQTASSKQYTWEILFFAVSFLAILVLGYVSYKCCYAKPQEPTKTLQTIVVA